MLQARKRVRDVAGLTFPEVLATIGVMAVMMAFALPTLRGMMAGYRLRGAAQEIFGAMQMARMEAIKENNRFMFQVTDETTYAVLDDDNNNGAHDEGEDIEEHDISLDQPGIKLTPGDPMTFLPNGRATTSGNSVMEVALYSAGTKNSRVITVTQGGAMRVLVR